MVRWVLSFRKENKGDNSKNLSLREVNRIQNYINGTNAERKPILTMFYGLPTFCFSLSLSLFLPQGQQTFHKKKAVIFSKERQTSGKLIFFNHQSPFPSALKIIYYDWFGAGIFFFFFITITG